MQSLKRCYRALRRFTRLNLSGWTECETTETKQVLCPQGASPWHREARNAQHAVMAAALALSAAPPAACSTHLLVFQRSRDTCDVAAHKQSAPQPSTRERERQDTATGGFGEGTRKDGMETEANQTQPHALGCASAEAWTRQSGGRVVQRHGQSSSLEMLISRT